MGCGQGGLQPPSVQCLRLRRIEAALLRLCSDESGKEEDSFREQSDCPESLRETSSDRDSETTYHFSLLEFSVDLHGSDSISETVLPLDSTSRETLHCCSVIHHLPSTRDT